MSNGEEAARQQASDLVLWADQNYGSGKQQVALTARLVVAIEALEDAVAKVGEKLDERSN